jgi:triphosphoribosyl-dephospho-CoA synthase
MIVWNNPVLEQLLGDKYRDACMAELTAIKPGNVHIFADGHGMVVQDFIQSANVSAPAIAQVDLTVGERILNATQATWNAVGCNTNLGIVLLAAPMIQAAYSDQGFCRESLQSVLKALTVEDAIETYQAIAMANPAGLGVVAEHDVQDAPQVCLLQGMQAAAHRDLIAQQYSDCYQAVFNALALYKTYLELWEREAWAVTAVHLHFLAEFEDSHIARKHGNEMAQAIQSEAKSHFHRFTSQENPKLYQATLLNWDADLKKRGINPGTSADLTVACLLAINLLH